MSVLSRPASTPCVGKCSHNVGDDICRGCGRTIPEVRDWNSYTPEQKAEVMARCRVRKTGLSYVAP